MAITLEQVSYAYDDRSLWRNGALEDINLKLDQGVFAGIVGATGSGKSTLLQHFNGILKPTSGKVQVFDYILQAGEKNPPLRELRRRVGLVFQFPEHQLFEDTVEKDICFGPLNFGMSKEEAKERTSRALNMLGLDDSFLSRNPFHLSGGQMRKVAIASVLAMDPDIIVLDEPTATLDPQSRAELAELLFRLQRDLGKTVIVVTHRMEEMLPYADTWIVMKDGRKIFQGSKIELVREANTLAKSGLSLPTCITEWNQLAARFGLEHEEPCLTAGSAAVRIAKLLTNRMDKDTDPGSNSTSPDEGGEPYA
ncbi:energy-coupling factor transport system ATP-binding protein [Fontibacillus panacisegetis]|uniref:Energy-coupling factor transporter ATP-binding protein EcfA2 n=1 Tax=Fontibacillus panacisegetis TaxID=670482 RepID=A0A1G7S975_9BACL|nr:energy-coupling factor transporter ATPase [Fontibacillus panacisegetis]SDG18989.1 energy-coupling factor transport system ATP-binding protein [Fontibacillus panacisegetis]